MHSFDLASFGMGLIGGFALTCLWIRCMMFMEDIVEKRLQGIADLREKQKESGGKDESRPSS